MSRSRGYRSYRPRRCGWCRCPTASSLLPTRLTRSTRRCHSGASRPRRSISTGSATCAWRRRRTTPGTTTTAWPARSLTCLTAAAGTEGHRERDLAPGGSALDGTAEEGGQPVDGGSAVGGWLLGCERRPGGATAELAASLGETARGDAIGKVRRLAGCPGQVPAVAEELGDANARQRGARHVPERQRVGPDRDARRAQRRDEQIGRGTEGEERVVAEMIGVAHRRFRPGDQGDEREVPGYQVIDHGAAVNPIARSRQLPLICPNASHDAFRARDRGIQICQRINFVHVGNSISR